METWNFLYGDTYESHRCSSYGKNFTRTKLWAFYQLVSQFLYRVPEKWYVITIMVTLESKGELLSPPKLKNGQVKLNLKKSLRVVEKLFVFQLINMLKATTTLDLLLIDHLVCFLALYSLNLTLLFNFILFTIQYSHLPPNQASLTKITVGTDASGRDSYSYLLVLFF